jgi:transcriptional regulator with XRE-family HTH domain
MKKNEKDILIGKKLRQLRTLNGLSQSALAEKSSVTFQQIQKYEKGVNRISSGRLHDFAEILGVDVSIFFDQLSSTGNKESSDYSQSDDGKYLAFAENKDSSSDFKNDIFESKETMVLLREYYKIEDSNKRKSIIDFIKAMS